MNNTTEMALLLYIIFVSLHAYVFKKTIPAPRFRPCTFLVQ